MTHFERIQPADVVRDECGWFYHPNCPYIDEGDTEAWEVWLAKHHVECDLVRMKDDFIGEHPYWDDTEGHCRGWEPSKPEGDGWFILAIAATEDGPACWWLRSATKEAA